MINNEAAIAILLFENSRQIMRMIMANEQRFLLNAGSWPCKSQRESKQQRTAYIINVRGYTERKRCFSFSDPCRPTFLNILGRETSGKAKFPQNSRTGARFSGADCGDKGALKYKSGQFSVYQEPLLGCLLYLLFLQASSRWSLPSHAKLQ